MPTLFRQTHYAQRKTISAAIAFAAMLSIAPSKAADPFNTGREDRAAAAITYNLTRFIVWPKESVQPENQELVLCIAIENNADDTIWQQFDGLKARGRVVAVRSLNNIYEINSDCHVAFLRQENRNKTLLHNLAEQGVVTISDDQRFLRDGGGIQLSINNDAATFDINKRSLSHAGVNVSSKLMRVGMSVTVASN